jgi:hypothetical protein
MEKKVQALEGIMFSDYIRFIKRFSRHIPYIRNLPLPH